MEVFAVWLVGMSIVSTTMCYPSAGSATQGVFIERRLRAICRWMPVQVVAPVPWFPLLRPVRVEGGAGASTAAAEEAGGGGPSVVRPRMFYLPGVMKRWDAAFYAAAFEKGLRATKATDTARLIDAHFVWPDGVGAWRVARQEGLPFVCTIRGKLVSQMADRHKRRLIAEMLREADALIAVSRSLATLANDVAGMDLGVHVIPNGVDRMVFHRHDGAAARAALGLPEQARCVVSVGHLQSLKGFDRLVEVWPEVRRRCGDVRLLLIGGEAGEPKYVERLNALIDAVNRGADLTGGGAAVTCLGRQPPETIARLLNAADLFALASRSEGWCNAVAEALACGCPVVATDVGGNQEIVRESRLGELVPLGRRDALAEAVCGALGREWERSYIAQVGGQRDWQQVGRECVDVFEKVLGRGEALRPKACPNPA